MSKTKQKARAQLTFNAYRVTSPTHEAKIMFATSVAQALSTYELWREVNEIGEVRFTLDPSWISALSTAGRGHIEQACRSCKHPGVATRYRADVGWGVGIPMDERDDPD